MFPSLPPLPLLPPLRCLPPRLWLWLHCITEPGYPSAYPWYQIICCEGSLLKGLSAWQEVPFPPCGHPLLFYLFPISLFSWKYIVYILIAKTPPQLMPLLVSCVLSFPDSSDRWISLICTCSFPLCIFVFNMFDLKLWSFSEGTWEKRKRRRRNWRERERQRRQPCLILPNHTVEGRGKTRGGRVWVYFGVGLVWEAGGWKDIGKGEKVAHEHRRSFIFLRLNFCLEKKHKVVLSHIVHPWSQLLSMLEANCMHSPCSMLLAWPRGQEEMMVMAPKRTGVLMHFHC